MDEARPDQRARTSSISEISPLPNEDYEGWKARLLEIAEKEVSQ